MNAVHKSLAPFLLLSTAFHLLLVLSWYARYDRQAAPEEIPIIVVPAPEEPKLASPQPPRVAPGHPARSPSQLAKKSQSETPAPQEPDKTPSKLAEKDKIGEQPIARKSRKGENETIVTPRLPTLRELLPPVYPSSLGTGRGTNNSIPLDSQEPRYVTYLTNVKQAIEIEWIYPALALRYGLQGKLRLEFTILRNGRLEEIHLVRSSGSAILDEEALRAVQAAAPFRPLPSSMGERQSFTGGFEYIDDRLKYSFAP